MGLRVRGPRRSRKNTLETKAESPMRSYESLNEDSDLGVELKGKSDKHLK